MTADHDVSLLWEDPSKCAEALAALADVLASVEEDDAWPDQLDADEDGSNDQDADAEGDVAASSFGEVEAPQNECADATAIEQDVVQAGMFDAVFGWLIDLIEQLFGSGSPDSDTAEQDAPESPTIYEDPIADVSGDVIMNTLELPDDFEIPQVDEVPEDDLLVDF